MPHGNEHRGGQYKRGQTIHRWKMADSTRKALFVGMSDEEFRTAVEIAAAAGQTLRSVQLKLVRLYHEGGVVERIYRPASQGRGRTGLWRLVPSGYVAPIYDPQSGVDARALDRALGGFTYVRKTNH